MNQKNPIKNMIPISEFAKYSDKDTNEIIAWIKDGSYVGKNINDEWYIEKFEFNSEFPDITAANKNWKDHLISSFWRGIGISILWGIIAIAIGGINPRGAAGLSNLLGGAFGVFTIAWFIIFVSKIIWHYIRYKKIPNK